MITKKEISKYVQEKLSQEIQCASEKGYTLSFNINERAYKVRCARSGSSIIHSIYSGNLEDAVNHFNLYTR